MQESHYPHGALKRRIKNGIAKTLWLCRLSKTTGLCDVRQTRLPLVRAEIIMYARWPEALFSRPVLHKDYIFALLFASQRTYLV